VLKKKFKQAYNRYESERQGELIDFEELESKPNRDKKVELPPMKQPQASKRSEYDQLFD
jgi:hypothetical protein